MSTTTVLP